MYAKLVDLKLTTAEKKKEAGVAMSDNDYPWGLSLSLDKEALDKLGVTTLPQVGGEFHFLAVAEVTSVNQSASVTQSADCRVGLQIKMMQILLAETAEEEKGEKETPATEDKETKQARKGGVLGY